MVNYFDYDYPAPTDRTAPFRATVSVFPTPWNPDTKLVHFGPRGLEVRPERHPRANLVFLIDVSGSMASPDKLPLLKSAFRLLVGQFAPDDTVAIVVYAGAGVPHAGGGPREARFAVAVAAFGQILRGDTRVGSFSHEDVLALAQPARGEDPFGYRAEFLNLVRLAGSARAMGER